jgi:predicted ATP-grasp superfamily ATP-dependent carboligase
MKASRQLSVIQDDSTVTVADVEGSLRVFYTDGRKTEYPAPEIGTVETRAEWKGGKLVVERSMENGVRTTQTYEVVDDGEKLVVKVRLEGGDLPNRMEFRRVYDAVNEEP